MGLIVTKCDTNVAVVDSHWFTITDTQVDWIEVFFLATLAIINFRANNIYIIFIYIIYIIDRLQQRMEKYFATATAATTATTIRWEMIRRNGKDDEFQNKKNTTTCTYHLTRMYMLPHGDLILNLSPPSLKILLIALQRPINWSWIPTKKSSSVPKEFKICWIIVVLYTNSAAGYACVVIAKYSFTRSAATGSIICMYKYIQNKKKKIDEETIQRKYTRKSRNDNKTEERFTFHPHPPESMTRMTAQFW